MQQWVKHCGTSSCVHVSKNPFRGTIIFRAPDPESSENEMVISRAEWEAFKEGIKAGTFDGI
jgi:hypothetical protein